MFMWIDMLHSNYDLSIYHLKDTGYSSRFISWMTASPLELDGCDVQSKLHFSAVWGCAKVAGYTEGRCLVGGLINNVQIVDSPDIPVAGPGLILAMQRAARGDPGCLVSVPCVSLRWPATQWSGPVLLEAFIVVMLRAVTQQLEYPHVSLQSGFLWLHPVITVLATRWTLDRVWCLLLRHWLPCSFCICLTPQKSIWFSVFCHPVADSRWYAFESSFPALWRGRFKLKSGKGLCFAARMDTLKFPITQMEDSVNVHSKSIPSYQHVDFISILYDIS